MMKLGAFRKWFSLIRDGFEVTIVALKENAKRYKSAAKETKKVRAVKLLAILARGYVEGRMVEAMSGWKLWVGESRKREMERGLKVGMIGRMLGSRKAYRAFQVWKEGVYGIQEEENARERRADCARRLIRKKITMAVKAAFHKLRHISLVGAKITALRRDAARRLVKMMLSKASSRLGWCFHGWVRDVQLERAKEWEARGEEDAARNAAEKIKGYMRMVFAKMAASAWRTWTEFVKYEEQRARNRFLGVDMIKRTITAAHNRKVASGFNTWVSFLTFCRKRDGEKKSGVRMVLMCLRRMENRELHWGFQRWAEEKDKGRIGELGREVGDEKLRRAISGLLFLVAGKEGRMRAKGFRTMKEEWLATKRRANKIKGCYYRWRRSSLYLAFVGWKDKVVGASLDGKSRKMGGEKEKAEHYHVMLYSLTQPFGRSVVMDKS
jgi:hypothetical protein